MATLKINWAEVEMAIPGFKKLWKAIKAETGTKVRSPKSVTLSDKAEAMMPNDSSCCRRYAVDLTEMKIVGRVHVSAGEWAATSSNPDKAVNGVPDGAALIDCEWNDFYRFFSVRVQVREGAISTKMLGA